MPQLRDDINAALKSLEDRLLDVEIKFISMHTSPTEPASAYALDVQSYAVLSHAAFEEFAESLCLRMLEEIDDRWEEMVKKLGALFDFDGSYTLKMPGKVTDAGHGIIEDGIIKPENEGEVTVVAYHPGNNNYLPTTVIMTVFTISAAALDDPTDAPLTPQQLRAAQKYIHGDKVYVSYGGHTYDADGKFVR